MGAGLSVWGRRRVGVGRRVGRWVGVGRMWGRTRASTSKSSRPNLAAIAWYGSPARAWSTTSSTRISSTSAAPAAFPAPTPAPTPAAFPAAFPAGAFEDGLAVRAERIHQHVDVGVHDQAEGGGVPVVGPAHGGGAAAYDARETALAVADPFPGWIPALGGDLDQQVAAVVRETLPRQRIAATGFGAQGNGRIADRLQ